MGGDETGYIPKSLDAQERFLWWEMDQLVLAVTLTSMGVINGSMFTGMCLGCWWLGSTAEPRQASIQSSLSMPSIGGSPVTSS